MMAPSDPGAALCTPFLAALPVSGVSISVVSEQGTQSTVGTSDRIAARLEELQFQLGEGPTRDVMRSGRPAVAADLRSASTRRAWPMFSAAAVATGARELFSLPLMMGPTAIGVVNMYALVLLPPWSDSDLRVASGLADSTVQPAIRLATRSAQSEQPLLQGRPTELRREVHQASGMLTVQLDCSIDEAIMRLRAYAFTQGRSVDDVARDVVARTLRFTATDD